MIGLINRFLFAGANSGENDVTILVSRTDCKRRLEFFENMQKFETTLFENLVYENGRQPMLLVAMTVPEFMEKYILSYPGLIIRRIISLEKIDKIVIDGKTRTIESKIADVKMRAENYLSIHHSTLLYNENSDASELYLFELCEDYTPPKQLGKPVMPNEMLSMKVDEPGRISTHVNIHYMEEELVISGTNIGRPDGFVYVPTSTFSLVTTKPGTTVLYSYMTDEQCDQRNHVFLYPFIREKTVSLGTNNPETTNLCKYVDMTVFPDDVNVLTSRRVDSAPVQLGSVNVTDIAEIGTRAFTIYGLKNWSKLTVFLRITKPETEMSINYVKSNGSESAATIHNGKMVTADIDIVTITPETSPLFNVIGGNSSGVFVPFSSTWAECLPDFVLSFLKRREYTNIDLYIKFDAAEDGLSGMVKIIAHNINILKHDCGCIYPIFAA